LTLHQCGDCTPAVRASDYPNDATFFSPPFLGAYDACDTPGDCAVGPRPPRRGSPPSYTYAGATRLRITGGAATPSAPALFSPQTSLQVLEKNRPRSWRRPPPAASGLRPSTAAPEARHGRGRRHDADRSPMAETVRKAHARFPQFSQEICVAMVHAPGLLRIGGFAYLAWADPPNFG
jgi:hypothetical protein